MNGQVTDNRNRQNYHCIDLAKFICAVMVVMIHFPRLNSSSQPVQYLLFVFQEYYTRIAVPFFFVCSGYFLYRKTSLDAFDVGPTKKYVVRLLRLYVIWTVIYFPSYLRDFAVKDKGFLYGAAVFIRSFLFTSPYVHLWYLPATAFSVALISFLLRKKWPPERIMLAAAMFYALGLLDRSWYGVLKCLPALDFCMQVIKKVIISTRDGLFTGFFFVGIGMLFAFRDYRLSRRRALVGFCVCMLALTVEATLLYRFSSLRDADVFVSLAPVAFFGFALVRQIELKDAPVYRTLRTLSTIMYLSHMLVGTDIAAGLLRMVDEALIGTWVFPVSIILLCILGGCVMIRLSEWKKLRWIRVLYT